MFHKREDQSLATSDDTEALFILKLRTVLLVSLPASFIPAPLTSEADRDDNASNSLA